MYGYGKIKHRSVDNIIAENHSVDEARIYYDLSFTAICEKIRSGFVDTETKREYIINIERQIVSSEYSGWFTKSRIYNGKMACVRGWVEDKDCYYNDTIYIWNTDKDVPYESIPVYRVRYAINGHIYDRYTTENDTKSFTDINGLEVSLDVNTERVKFEAHMTDEAKKEIEDAKKQTEIYNNKVMIWFNSLSRELQLNSTIKSEVWF